MRLVCTATSGDVTIEHSVLVPLQRSASEAPASGGASSLVDAARAILAAAQPELEAAGLSLAPADRGEAHARVCMGLLADAEEVALRVSVSDGPFRPPTNEAPEPPASAEEDAPEDDDDA